MHTGGRTLSLHPVLIRDHHRVLHRGCLQRLAEVAVFSNVQYLSKECRHTKKQADKAYSKE
jgi:hypothetical protein